MLRHVDPATNTVDRSVELPFENGFLSSSATTVVFGDPQGTDGWFRLTPGATALTSLPVPQDSFVLYPAGEGAWNQPAVDGSSLDEADYVTGSATPDKVVAIDGSLIGADENAIYVSGLDASGVDMLVRYVDAATAPTTVMNGATLTTANGDQDPGLLRQRSIRDRQPEGAEAVGRSRVAHRRHQLGSRSPRQRPLTRPALLVEVRRACARGCGPGDCRSCTER